MEKLETNIDTPQTRLENAARSMSDFVNIMGHNPKDFAERFNREHPTLKQSFTKLCLVWLEFVASDEFHTDGRSQASKDTAQRLLKGFDDDLVLKPSQYLPFI